MCGIVGVVQYKSEVSREIRQRALKILFSDTMLKTETRGEDATGLYQVHTNGDWTMTKKGLKVSEWLFQNANESGDQFVYSDFMDSWLQHPEELTSLVGHCRKATVGSRGKDNEDNHPFAVQVDKDNAILGIHNGTLDNHEVIFDKLPKMLKRQGKVDSESIFHLMFHLSEHGTKPWTGEMIKVLGRRIQGAYACIVVNSKFPSRVATFRDGRPMEFFLISPLNIVLICSEKKFAEAALDKYEFIRRMLDPGLPELQTYDQALAERDYRIFDTTKEFPRGQPTYQDINSISEKGEVRGFSTPIEADWKVEKPTTSPTKPNATYGGNSAHSYPNNQSNAAARITKHSASNPGSSVRALPATTKKDDDDIVTIVEAEIGGEADAKKASEEARSLGICTHYDQEVEIARSIGMTQVEVDKLTKVELANLVATCHFNFGYAVSRFDSKKETESIRSKGRELTKRLEQVETKKLRAQNHLWERNQLITIMFALATSKYQINLQNIGISLAAFSSLTKDRRNQILATAKTIFEDKSVRTAIGQLHERYKDAEERKKGKEQRTEKASG